MFTYTTLKQAIQDWMENDAAEFTAATGSGVAPLDLCIQLAEQRMYKDIDYMTACAFGGMTTDVRKFQIHLFRISLQFAVARPHGRVACHRQHHTF